MAGSDSVSYDEEKKSDAGNIKSIIAFVKARPGVSEKDLANGLGMNSVLLRQYLAYLVKKDWISAKKGIMGPQKYSISKSKMVEKGEKIVPSDEESFNEVVESLTTDFIGVMKLWSETDSGTYSVALVVSKGDIVAVTFEHLEDMSVVYGDAAMKMLDEKFAGTKGNLDI